MRQVKAKRLRAEQRTQEPERTPKWWEDPVIMSFMIALILSAMIIYVFILEGEWIAAAIDMIEQIQDTYLRWVNHGVLPYGR